MSCFYSAFVILWLFYIILCHALLGISGNRNKKTQLSKKEKDIVKSKKNTMSKSVLRNYNTILKIKVNKTW